MHSINDDAILCLLTTVYEKAQLELSGEPRHTSAILACNLIAMAMQQRKQYLARSEELENFPITWPEEIPKRNKD